MKRTKKHPLGIILVIIILAGLALIWFFQTSNQDAVVIKEGSIKASDSITESINYSQIDFDYPRIEINVSRRDATVTLRDSSGQEIAPSIESDEMTKVFDLPRQPDTTKDWQVEITNPDPTIELDYTIEVPVLPSTSTVVPPPTIPTTDEVGPVTVVPTVNSSESGQNVALSITVEESVVSIVAPISGAQVTANITGPDGDVTTIILQENDPSANPGVYTGSFNGNTTGGTYEVEYVISGENSAGEPFVQTTTDQFTIAPAETGQNQGHTKKYDINWGSKINLIGY
jgi:hypothetical protein